MVFWPFSHIPDPDHFETLRSWPHWKHQDGQQTDDIDGAEVSIEVCSESADSLWIQLSAKWAQLMRPRATNLNGIAQPSVYNISWVSPIYHVWAFCGCFWVLALAKHTQDSVALGLDPLCARDPAKFSVLVVHIQRMHGGNSRKGWEKTTDSYVMHLGKASSQAKSLFQHVSTVILYSIATLWHRSGCVSIFRQVGVEAISYRFFGFFRTSAAATTSIEKG